MPEVKLYRVIANVTPDGETFVEMKSDWMSDRDTAITAMQTLQDDSHLAEIETRTVVSAANADGVPKKEYDLQ